MYIGSKEWHEHWNVKRSICFLNPRRLKERRWLFQIVEYSESQLVSGWFPAGSTQTQPRRDTNSIIITQERTHRLLMILEVKHIWLEEPLRLLLRNGAEQQCNKRPSEWNTVLLGLETTSLAKMNGIFHINKGNKSWSNSSNVSRVSSYGNFFKFQAANIPAYKIFDPLDLRELSSRHEV